MRLRREKCKKSFDVRMGIWSDLFGNSFPKKASLALDGLVGFFSTLSGRSFPPEITTNNRCLKHRVPSRSSPPQAASRSPRSNQVGRDARAGP
jgi:hypothetical protein